jgi:hypothetical protein
MNTLIDLNKVINVDEKLDDRESMFRKKMLDRIISTQDLLHQDDFAGEEKEILKSLVDKDVLVLEEGKIVFAYPVSKKPTNHHVELADGREFFSMCAIDALGSTFVFEQDTKISSICPVSGEEIHVTIKNKEIVEYSPENIHVIHVDLAAVENWAANC